MSNEGNQQQIRRDAQAMRSHEVMQAFQDADSMVRQDLIQPLQAPAQVEDHRDEKYAKRRAALRKTWQK